MRLSTFIIHQINLLLKKIPLKIMSTEDSINYLLTNNVSLSRYGDGELNLIMGGKIHFQEENKELAKRLKNILSLKEEKDFIVGIPISINSTKEYDNHTTSFWESNMLTGRMHWHRLCNRNKIYINASFTWCYMDYKNKKEAIRLFLKIPLLWENKNILIVEGMNTKLGVNNTLFNNTKSIRRIICPASNAYNKYNLIFNTVIATSKNLDLILISLGPTATILSYDLYKKGIRAIDIGHINKEYEDYLCDYNIKEKNTLTEEEYNKQIIKFIK